MREWEGGGESSEMALSTKMSQLGHYKTILLSQLMRSSRLQLIICMVL